MKKVADLWASSRAFLSRKLRSVTHLPVSSKPPASDAPSSQTHNLSDDAATMEAGKKAEEPGQVVSGAKDDEDANKELHEGFMREALAMAEHALATNETPVGCVFVHNGIIIGRGMNATNRTLNGTRHAEFIGIAEILNTPADVDPDTKMNGDTATSPEAATSPEDSGYGSPEPVATSTKAQVWPHQKQQKPRKYDASILQECDLYVTVEPCIMCASLLRQYCIRKVYYGATNDRFGGTGGVLNIHKDGVPEPPYPVSGGWLREEAIMMLRRFYVQNNEKAPEDKMRKKDRTLKTEIEAEPPKKGHASK